MKKINELNIKIFADGANIESMKLLSELSYIKGFTTNPTLMKKSGVSEYKKFAKEVLQIIKDKPISFEVFADDIKEMKEQAKEINSWGKNINIKIPITNTKGESTSSLISELSSKGIVCNVTAIFSNDQILDVINKIDIDAKLILSVFAGRIADTGRDPILLIKESLKITQKFKNIELLWASPREVLNIFQANEVGCHIITISDDLLKKLNNLGKDLEQFSLETVSMFYNDAKQAGYKIITDLQNKKNS